MPCTALSPIAATRRAPSRDGLVSLAAVTAIASLAMLAIGTSRAQPSPIRITREAPVVTYIEVDPRNPPPDAPAFDGHESGLCRATFEIRTSISYTASAAPRRTMRVTPTSLEAVTRLKLEVFTLKGVSAKVHAHEEAHRQINEHFYREAADVARELAQATVGKPVAGTGARPPRRPRSTRS